MINKYQDSKLLAAQLLVLKSFKGFITRAKDIFDTPSGNAQFARMSAITMLRFMAAGIDVYLPTEQWSAAFDYIVQPFYPKPSTRFGRGSKAKKKCQRDWNERCYIYDAAAFQIWLREALLPRLEDLHTVLIEGNYQKPVYWDNKLLYGTANFISHKDRYLRLGEAERLLMLAAVQATQSSILGLNAYNLTGIFETLDTIAKKYGFEQSFRGRSGTAKDRFEAIKSERDLFSFKSDQDATARQYMKLSYDRLRSSLQSAYKAWKILDSTESDSVSAKNLIDPRLVAPFGRIFNTAWPNMFGMMGINLGADLNFEEVESGEVLSAVVAGEKVRVNLKRFFYDPPQSLTMFMPTHFVKGKEHF